MSIVEQPRRTKLRQARLSDRRSTRLTQQQLADQLGVNRVTVARWESGESDPSLAMALQVAKILGRSVEQLFGHQPLFTAEEQAAKDADWRALQAKWGSRFGPECP